MQFTMEELIQAARERGFAPSKRLLQDWVELGLLDRPERHGLGRGKGVRATWSQEQQGLFINLLQLRQTVNRVGWLSNHPVSMWLYFGDAYVPLRQVRLALSTWQGQTANTSLKAVRRTVEQLFDVTTVRLPRKESETLLNQIAEMLFRYPRRFDEDDQVGLRKLLMPVLDPGENGLVKETLGGMAFTAEAYIGLLTARLTAVVALTNDEIDDSLFHWARYTNLVSHSGYQQYLTQMTTSGAVRGLTIPSMNELVTTSCRDLVTLLGIGLGMPDEATDQSLNHPAVWKARKLYSIVQGEPAAGGVKLIVKVQSSERQGVQQSANE
jgi:hypothetical protein